MTTIELMRCEEVLTAVGISRATLYRRIKDGTFPRPIQVGPRCVRWKASDLAEWQDQRPRSAEN